MTCVARFVAASLVLVLALFPLALEQCRTACATPAPLAQSSAPSAHACHDTAADADEAVATPMPRTCGHSDEAGVAASIALGASRTRVAVHAAPAVLTAQTSAAAFDVRQFAPPGMRPAIEPRAVPRNLPLRL